VCVVDRGGKIPLVVGNGDFSCSFLASTPQLGRGRAGWVVGMASYDVFLKRGGASRCGVVVPWPRLDIVDVWP
jgi:hypothetical protein